jgi:hypothetical protein
MHRLNRLTLLVLLVVVAFFYPVLAPTAHRIDREHFALITHGMTEADVEAILGAPAGVYDWAVPDEATRWSGIARALKTWREVEMQPRTVTLGIPSYSDDDRVSWSLLTATTDGRGGLVLGTRRWEHSETHRLKTWTSRAGVFYVTFDDDRRVTSVGDLDPTRIDPPWRRWWGRLTAVR